MQWHTQTADETEAVGALLAGSRAEVSRQRESRARAGGDEGRPFTVLYLVGELGAGKTTLARGFVRGSGIPSTVRSPSYNLLEVHETRALCIVHLDLYRIHDPSEIESLGLRDWARPGVVWLVEWPERGADHLPSPDLTVSLGIGRDGRHSINAEAHSAFGDSWLQCSVEMSSPRS
jgi:tRNA threonylcarbamoyladenosine biosynthesis protein TsaE